MKFYAFCDDDHDVGVIGSNSVVSFPGLKENKDNEEQIDFIKTTLEEAFISIWNNANVSILTEAEYKNEYGD